MLLYFFLRGDESDYSEDAPYGENKSDDGSTGSVSKTSVTELKKTNDVLVMTTYIQDIIGEVFGDSNDQVRFQFHINSNKNRLATEVLYSLKSEKCYFINHYFINQIVAHFVWILAYCAAPQTFHEVGVSIYKPELCTICLSLQTEEFSDENKSIVWFLVKQVRPGMDLSRVVLPTFILEPRSFLEKISDYYYHADFISE